MTVDGTRVVLSGRAVAASMLGQAGQVVCQTVFFVLLARMLAPDAFGLVAASLVVVNVTAHLASAGLRNAVVQLPHLTDLHVRVALTMQQALTLLVFAAMAASAGVLAQVFRMPDLEPVLQGMALAYAVRGLTLGDGLLMRSLRVQRLAGIELSTYALGHGLVALPLALAGHGVRALVAGHLAHAVLRTSALCWSARQPWRPAFSPAHARELLRVGFGTALSQLVDLVAWEGDNFVVGRWLGASSLGVYERAYRLTIVPAGMLGQAMWQILFPAMSAMGDELERRRRMFSTATGLVVVLGLSTTVLLVPLAGDLVLVALGPSWREMTDVFVILLATVVLRANTYVTDSLVMSTGQVYRLAGRRVVFAVLVVTGALVGQAWGVRGVALGIVAALAVTTLVMVQLCLSVVRMSWREYAELLAPGVILCMVLGPGTVATTALLHAADVPPAVPLLIVPVAALLLVVAFTSVASRLPLARRWFAFVEQCAALLGSARLAGALERVSPSAAASREVAT